MKFCIFIHINVPIKVVLVLSLLLAQTRWCRSTVKNKKDQIQFYESSTAPYYMPYICISQYLNTSNNDIYEILADHANVVLSYKRIFRKFLNMKQ